LDEGFVDRPLVTCIEVLPHIQFLYSFNRSIDASLWVKSVQWAASQLLQVLVET
jgi:6-phosphogluconolactonase (cycloisomerase 2 family)